MRDERGKGLLFAFSLLPFILLATLNSAGYRYGASDQAFYIPAVLMRLDPALFPRDRVVLDAQAPLQFADEIVAAIGRVTGAGVPATCAALYVVSLVLLAGAAWLIGAVLYRTPWTTLALLAALTLRHAVADSGTNTLEGYFHPRQLAFALGALGVAAFLRGRHVLVVAALAAAAALHPTTAMWFAIWVGAAAFVAERRLRVPLAALSLLAAAIAAWALTGPLAPRLAVMDDEWLAVIEDKDYLFPLQWSWDAWIVNLAYAPIIVWVRRLRVRAGIANPRESGLVVGCLALVLVFAVAVPLNAARIALAIQLQPARVFWMLDLLAVIYVVWLVAEGQRGEVRRTQLAATVLMIASIVRGSYVKFIMFPERAIAAVDVRDDDWGRVMRWARTTPAESAWLAHPKHALLYGTSVRLAGHRDVMVEPVKDSALGMYDRAVAMRTRDRLRELHDFDRLTPERARALASEYDLRYLVTEQTLDLPPEFASGRLRVYDLRAR